MKQTVTIHCYAKQESPGIWVALCLNFDLAAQGESFDDVRYRLDTMVNEYVAEALTGPDSDHAEYFLNRRAPLTCWVRYYWYRLVRRLQNGPRSFTEELRLALAK